MRKGRAYGFCLDKPCGFSCTLTLSQAGGDGEGPPGSLMPTGLALEGLTRVWVVIHPTYLTGLEI